MVRMMRAN